MDSSPGFPYNTLPGAATNKELFSNHFNTILQTAVERIMLLSSTDPDYLDGLTADEKIRQGFCDPFMVFIKNDPHSDAKIKTGRLRLIFHESIVQSIVTRFFSQTQNKAEIAMWDKIPSQPGFGVCPDGIQRLVSSFKTKNKVYLKANDVSGFDWTMQYMDFQYEALARISLMDDLEEGGCSAQMQNLIKNTYSCLRDKIIIFKDGTWAPLAGCVWPSGDYNTSSTNSRRRTAMGIFMYCMDECERLSITPEEYFAKALPFDSHITKDAQFSFPSIKANGDDAIEMTQREAKRSAHWYSLLGADVKEEHTFTDDSFSFCSTVIFHDGRYYQSNVIKSLIKWVAGKMSEEQTRAMHEMIGDNPDKEFMDIFERAVGLRNAQKEEQQQDGKADLHLNQTNSATETSGEGNSTQSGENYR